MLWPYHLPSAVSLLIFTSNSAGQLASFLSGAGDGAGYATSCKHGRVLRVSTSLMLHSALLAVLF
jgi:hypothetical protein